jgi:uncharacterized membrane protein YdbT with pleckstrin-like domain/predicted RNA-binding Zn-ribbon protein involved in translation (DUF1610 family)
VPILCDNCDSPIDTAGRAVGERIPCPACGDVNVVRAEEGPNSARGSTTPAAAQASPRASAPAAPPAAATNRGEGTILIVRRAMFRSRPLSFVGLWIGVIGGTAGAIALALMPPLWWAAILAGLAALASGITLACWKVLTLGEQLTITTRRTVQRTGLLSKRTSEVLHTHIRNVTIDQSFTDRILRVGTLTISSSADDDDEIVMREVPSPEAVRATIDRYRAL